LIAVPDLNYRKQTGTHKKQLQKHLSHDQRDRCFYFKKNIGGANFESYIA